MTDKEAADVEAQETPTGVSRPIADSPSPAPAPSTTSETSATPEDGPQAPPPVDRSVVVSDSLRTTARLCLRVLIIVATAFVGSIILREFWQGILPVILAIIVCTVLSGPTNWLRRHRVPAALAALLTLLSFFLLIGAVFVFIAPDIVRQSGVLYLQAFDGIQRLRLWLEQPPLNIGSSELDVVINEAATWLQEQAGAIAGGILSGVSTVTSIAVTLGVVLVLTFFFLKDGHRFLPWVRDVAGQRQGWHATEVLTRAWRTLGGFIRAQALVSLVDAIFIGLGLIIIGVPMALALAVITFVAGFIPIIGAFTAGALAVLIALVSLGVPQALATLVVVVAVQQLEGNILSPILQSRAMNLHPVIILVSVTIGGSLFGIVGAFLAVPAAAMIAVLFRYLQDVTMLRSGEKSLSDVPFVTEEGIAVGEMSVESGLALRTQYHSSDDVTAR
ncbi:MULTISPECIES: AI-2E family transporter [unclassified Corynebacterium]|uniref:AI-2E family transporter n=1 Tax=unclassified Corynebacterium TaxID=2624378 RepID=UPI0029C9F0ED|nr:MULTISPECIES: AI-2E family transporter [unclassified Corynebacterium]WPF66909.1 AI-2E family transporter [Corynebacterium sp. 22KM0430]WPF69396.1 AI-2E family transporter [Corynebacterium sp. 21KM1197]